jgi:hypothetical protein
MKLTKIQQDLINKLKYGHYHIGVSTEGRHILVLSGYACGFGRVHGSTVRSLVRKGLLKPVVNYKLK